MGPTMGLVRLLARVALLHISRLFAILLDKMIGKASNVKISLGKKLVLLLVAIAVALSSFALVIGYRVVDDMNGQHYMNRANEIAATVSDVVDKGDAKKLVDKAKDAYRSAGEPVFSDHMGEPVFDAYVTNYDHLADAPEFQSLLGQLRNIQSSNDVNCLYLVFLMPEDRAFVYLVDAAEEDACPTGCIDPVYEVNEAVLHNPAVGFPAYITDTPEYGWLVSAGAPVYDETGDVVCYAFVDISMDAIKQQQTNYFATLVGGIIGLAAVIGILSIFYVRRTIVRPLNSLSEAAARYCTPEEGQHSSFEELDIHTGDEIESLHKSMIQMEHDIDGYIDNLVRTRMELRDTQIEADRMSNLAHTDALTGMLSKLSYDQQMEVLESQVANGSAAFGLAVVDLNYLKQTNDNYGHECGNVSLVRLSNTIQSTFIGMSAYRIGGDEFVVLFMGDDCLKAQELVDEFKATIERIQHASGLKPWERTSAAIGLAVYDTTIDTSANDVFRRADSAMYDNKRQMKGVKGAR